MMCGKLYNASFLSRKAKRFHSEAPVPPRDAVTDTPLWILRYTEGCQTATNTASRAAHPAHSPRSSWRYGVDNTSAGCLEKTATTGADYDDGRAVVKRGCSASSRH